MYHEKKFRPGRWIALLCAVLAIAAGGTAAARRAAADLAAQSAQSVREAVLRSAVQCYAVEGAYPSSLAYLEDNYGLIVNENRYIVTYDTFGSNILPEVSVLVK